MNTDEALAYIRNQIEMANGTEGDPQMSSAFSALAQTIDGLVQQVNNLQATVNNLQTTVNSLPTAAPSSGH